MANLETVKVGDRVWMAYQERRARLKNLGITLADAGIKVYLSESNDLEITHDGRLFRFREVNDGD